MEQLERLSSIARRRIIPANHYIFRDGDEAISFAAVNSGVVKLIKTTSEGERHVIGLVYAPEFLGHTFAETLLESRICSDGCSSSRCRNLT
ncbi:hypothetical protein T281_14040 [Rhodomicrobium udaipurense JA643]|uniref:cyclic nucleotide-binding domain-containing protein n=1 Tax=Rhodomicrobium udaipurense TaxID=1202716 RepID=UPI00045AFBEB|nr:hypothetical protein T281_14040 [Rhodomicrobium udaipurense JA643]